MINTIAMDDRHIDVTILSTSYADARKFPDWHMKYGHMNFDEHRKLFKLSNPADFERFVYADQLSSLLMDVSENFENIEFLNNFEILGNIHQ